MKFDVYVYNTPHNAWTYTRGYINAFQRLGMLGKAGDIVSWHNPNANELFSTPSKYIVLIGPEHHRCEIFGPRAKREAIVAWKHRAKKKLIGICYESSLDPFGCDAWDKAGHPWLKQNVHKYGSSSAQCYSTNGMIEQFKCLDYIFTQDEVDMAWFRSHGINAHWLPACADIEMFRPIVDKPLNRAGFIGNVWWPRDELKGLYPFPFDIVSTQKTGFNEANVSDITNGLVNAYNQFNIAVNMRSPFAGISMRTFELMACGVTPIIYQPAPNRTANLSIFNGWPHVTWFCEWSPDDRKKIMDHYTHMVAHYDETRNHGIANRKLIVENHTPEHRIRTIIQNL